MRDKYISFRVEEQEKRLINELAKSYGVKTSEFLRMCIDEFIRSD